ncbi:amidohydrolase family protein [Geomonas sp. Red875]|uniref:Amidohydrolase family protein n=2 Tax=Geomesophilobacter sediminis TaxID=2798584 RepID=A0A8J7JBJ0_9BACT|nr:amidohydrolase family protein [Geomesophilobacter sediminis]
MEQNDPKGQTLKSVKSKLACDGFHQISILQYSVVVDSHMHIESGRCAPLQWMQDLSVLTKKATRRCLENVGEFGGYLIEAGGLIYRLSELFWNPMAGWRDLQKDLEENDGRYKSPTRHIRNLTQQSSKSTELIADDFIGKRSKVYEWLQKERLYSGISNLMVFSVVMTMDMEYAHVDGYFGLKLYNALYRTLEDIEKLEPCAYWCPVHGHWEKQPPPLKGTYVKEKIVRNEDGDVYHRTGSDGHPAHPVLQKDFQSVEKATLVGSYFDTNTNKTVQVAIDSVPVLTSSDETKKYEQWEKQLKNTELAVLKYPLKFLPMFHYDPRRWQPGNSNDFPMRQVSDEGLYLGFKMYTAQGYRPLDRRLPIMRDFYEQCSARRIPIMNHCTPDGAATFERKEYMKFVHWNDTREDKWQESRDAEAYFNERFVSPHAWQEVLDRYDLHLCLAHFGGPTELGMHWNEDLIDMIESGDYPNLYTDISSSFACDAFRNNFKSIIQKHPRLRDRILFGTDWYMTLSYSVPFVGKDFKQYCRDTKRCLDDFDTSLWPRFTQYNPFRFYRLDEQVPRLAKNFIEKRRLPKIIKELKPIKQEVIDEILKVAAYFTVANRSFTACEEAKS